jgi:hypothetical protein
MKLSRVASYMLWSIGVMWCQTNPPPNSARNDLGSQSNTECSVNALKSNVQIGSMTCTNIDVNLAKQFKAIADGTKRDAKLLDLVLAELRKISSQVTPASEIQINSAPGGFVISGGTVIAPTVNNRNPLPEIEASEPTPVPVVAHVLARMPFSQTHPGSAVIVSVKSVFYNPAFVADCSVPCEALSIAVLGDYGRESINSQNFQTFHNPTNMSAGATFEKTLYPGTKLKLLYQSLDERTLSISNVRPIAP